MPGHGFLRVAVGVSVFISALSGQTERKLTARELFYTPVVETKPRQETKVQTPKQSTRQTATRPEQAAQEPTQTTSTRQRQETPDSKQTLQTVAAEPPLALKYKILKESNGDYLEVDPEMVFRSGDRIRVSVEANDDAYLYIVQQGSSKTWNVLFPNEETENGDNHIRRNRTYEIPAGARFAFDEQPGTERLFVIVSREPLADIEKLIYSLATSEPAADQPSKSRPKMLLAQARPIDDGIISKLQTHMLARDLVFEKVDESKPGPTKESAMYVATEDRSPNARLIVDLKLNHR